MLSVAARLLPQFYLPQFLFQAMEMASPGRGGSPWSMRSSLPSLSMVLGVSRIVFRHLSGTHDGERDEDGLLVLVVGSKMQVAATAVEFQDLFEYVR